MSLTTEAELYPDGYDDPSSFFYVPEPHRAAWEKHAASAPLAKAVLAAREIAGYEAYGELSEKRASEARDRADALTTDEARAARKRLTPILRELRDRLVPVEPRPAAAPPRDRLEVVAEWHFGTPLAGGHDWEEMRDQRYLNDPAGYLAKGTHALRAEYVLEQEARDADAAQRAARALAAYTCPVCGDVTGGAPAARQLAPTVRPSWNYPVPAAATQPVPELTSCAKCFIVAQALYLEQARQEVVKAPAIRREALVKAAVFPPKALGGER